MDEGTMAMIGLAAGIAAGLWVSAEAGFRLGRREAARKDAEESLTTIQGAILALLGLMLGFAFSGAMSRFVDRQDLLAREAIAIGSAHLRADLLPEPHRTATKELIATYAAERVALSRERGAARSEEMSAALGRRFDQVWVSALAGANERPTVMQLVLPAVDEVGDLLTLRNAQVERRLPTLLQGLLLVCAMASMVAVGYARGWSARRHHWFELTLGLLVWASLWATMDLDHPRRGLIHASVRPLEAVAEATRAN